MANPWENDPIAKGAAAPQGKAAPWEQDPVQPTAPGQSYGAGLAQQAVQGATLGWGDELQSYIAAALAQGAQKIDSLGRSQPPVVPVQAPTFEEQQQEALGSLRSDLGKFSQENPVSSLAANVAGGIATGGAGVGALKAVGAPIAGMKGALAAGGTIGAAAGAGTSEEGSRLAGAGTGALFGALAGGAVSGLGKGVTELWRKMAPGTQDRMAAIAQASGLTPTQIETRLRALGPKATLADVADVFQSAGDVAASRLGPTSRKLQQLIRRDETQFGRLMEPIRKTVGGKDVAYKTIGELKELRHKVASPMYEKAFSQPLQMTDRLRDLFGRKETAKAWSRVKSIGASDPNIDPSLLGKGTTPSFRGMQSVTEMLWDRAESMSRQGHKKFAKIVRDLRNEILEEMDKQSPDDFAKARKLWAGTKQADDMLELGGDFLKSTADDVKDAMRSMSSSDKEFYRLGIGKAIEQRLARANDTTDLARMFRNQDFREKVYAAFPSKESAVDFLNTVRAETIKKATTNRVGRGSQTQPRQVAERQIAGGTISPGDVSKSGLLSKILAGVSGPREKTFQEIGDLLLSQDPATQRKAIQMMMGGPASRPMMLTPSGAAASNLSGQGSGRKR